MAAMNLNVPPLAIRATDTSRVDLLLIAEMVTPGARVLDIGCGDGTLLRAEALIRESRTIRDIRGPLCYGVRASTRLSASRCDAWQTWSELH